MPEQSMLSRIAVKLAACENQAISRVSSGDPLGRTYIREISQENCMPRLIVPDGEYVGLQDKEYTLLVSPDGAYKGFIFVFGDQTYKFSAAFNSVDHRRILEELGFLPISPLTLKERKITADREKPLSIKGSIVFQPQENTIKIPEWTYRKTIRPTGAVEGLVFRGGDGVYHFLPGSHLDPYVRILGDHGYLPAENGNDGMNAEAEATASAFFFI